MFIMYTTEYLYWITLPRAKSEILCCSSHRVRSSRIISEGARDRARPRSAETSDSHFPCPRSSLCIQRGWRTVRRVVSPRFGPRPTADGVLLQPINMIEQLIPREAGRVVCDSSHSGWPLARGDGARYQRRVSDRCHEAASQNPYRRTV